MLQELILVDIFLVLCVIVLTLILIQKRKNQRIRQVRAIEEKLANAIHVERIPRMEEDQLVASPSSKKYHSQDCRLAANIKDKEFATLEEFKKKKYPPCGICMKK